MAKRHPALVEVSRDHHEGLLLALRLQQGEQALPKLWSHETAWQVRFLATFFEEHLRNHFKVEEDEIFPIAETRIAEAVPIVNTLREDHRFFENAVRSMSERPESVTRDELAGFGKRLEDHIRMEDRTLFLLMENHLPEALLEKLSRDVQSYYPSR